MELNHAEVGVVFDRMRDLAVNLDPVWGEDAYQDAWVSVLKAKSTLSSTLGALMPTAVLHSMRKIVRRESRRADHEGLAHHEESPPSTDDVVSQLELARDIMREVESLPEPYGDTLTLRYFEGLTLAQIARRKGLGDATVRSHHRRAIEALRARLDERSGDRQSWLAALAVFVPRKATAAQAAPAPAWGAVASLAGVAALVVGATGWYVIAGGAEGPNMGPNMGLGGAGVASPEVREPAVDAIGVVDGARARTTAGRVADVAGGSAAVGGPEVTPSEAPLSAGTRLRFRDALDNSDITGDITLISHGDGRRFLDYPAPDDEISLTGMAPPLRIAFGGADAYEIESIDSGQIEEYRPPSRSQLLSRIFYLTAPGYAWKRHPLSHEAEGWLTLDLQPASTLEVSLIGDLNLEDAYLRLRAPEEGPVGTPLAEVALASSDVSMVWERLPPRKWRVCVELGDRFTPRLLGEAMCETRAHEMVSVEVEVEGGLEPLNLVKPAGTLSLIGAPAVPAMWLEMFAEGRWAALELHPTEVGDGVVEYSWSGEPVARGRYPIRLSPFEHYDVLDVQAPGEQRLRFDLSDFIRVVVHLRSEVGERVPKAQIKWRRTGSVRDEFSDFANWDAEAEAYVIHTLPGEIDLDLGGVRGDELERFREQGLSIRRRRVPYNVRRDGEEVDLIVEPANGLRITVVEKDGAEVSFDPEWMGLDIVRVDGEGEIVADYLPQEGTCEVSHSGTYRISFQLFGPYALIPPREVHVEPGRYTEVVFDAVPE